MVSVLGDLPAPIMPVSACAATELMARSRYGLRRFDSADHFMGLSSQSAPQKLSHQPNQNDHCIKDHNQREPRLKDKVERLRDGETRHRAASTGSLNYLKKWVQSDRVWCAAETVEQLELEADSVPESSKMVRKRRASLPEAQIQPDALIALEAVWALAHLNTNRPRVANQSEDYVVKPGRRDRRRRASLPEALILPDALLAVDAVSDEQVVANQSEDYVVKPGRRDRRRRASLPEALILPDALLAVGGSAAYEAALKSQFSSDDDLLPKESEPVMLKNRRERRRRPSLPEAVIRPDSLVAVKAFAAYNRINLTRRPALVQQLTIDMML